MSMVTWNMQGGTAYAQSKWRDSVIQLVKHFTVVCLQEAGELPPTAVSIDAAAEWATSPPSSGNWLYAWWNIGTRSRQEPAYILWYEADPNGNRVNLAICSKILPAKLLYAAPGKTGGRPSVGMQFDQNPGPINIFTLHAFSGGGGDATGLITNINAIGGRWFALGDYNREPNSWAPPAGTLCPPNGVTHPPKAKLDYMVQSAGPAVSGQVQQGGIWSDHYFVAYS